VGDVQKLFGDSTDTKDLCAEAGTSGLKQYSGYVQDELLSSLQGRSGAKIFREMADNDATIGSVLHIITQAMRKVAWRVEPPKTIPPGLEAQVEQGVVFVEKQMEELDTPWEDVVAEAVTMLTYGFAPLEIVYRQTQEGLIGWNKLALRAQDTLLRWEMDENGNWTGMWQQDWSGRTVFLPKDKLLLFRTTKTKNNPEGRSILRNAYRAWYMKKKLESIEGIGIERDLAGIPVAKLPAKLIAAAQAGDANALMTYNSYKTMIRNLRQDEQMGVIIPSDMEDGKPLFDISLLSTGSRRSFDVGATITRYMQEMSMSTATDFVLLGHGARGTQALATTKVDVFLDSVQGYLDTVGSTFSDQGVAQLWELNGWDQRTRPSIVPDNSNQVDLERLAPMLTALASLGMPLFPDTNLESWLREQAGLPEPSPEAVQLREMTSQNMFAASVPGSEMNPYGSPDGQQEYLDDSSAPTTKESFGQGQKTSGARSFVDVLNAKFEG
jgi:hypothetical protein